MKKAANAAFFINGGKSLGFAFGPEVRRDGRLIEGDAQPGFSGDAKLAVGDSLFRSALHNLHVLRRIAEVRVDLHGHEVWQRHSHLHGRRGA